MELREMSDENYRIVCSWWESHSWPVIPRESLPRYGRIAFDGAFPVCAGFLYLTDSSIAWVEFIVKNPEATHEQADAGLNAVIDSLCERAKYAGYASILTSASNERLMTRYETHGFVRVDKGMTNLIRRLS